MAQQFSIRSTLDKFVLIHNLPIEFFIENRRPIKFRCPSIREVSSDLNLRIFIGLMTLDKKQIAELKFKVNVKINDYGSLAQAFLFDDNYNKIISKYLVMFIQNAEYKNKEIHVDNEKLNSYELNYIIETIMVSLSRKDYEEKQEAKEEEVNPIMAKILAAQKESEEKLKKKKQKGGKGYSIEEILLAVSYEFGISLEELLNRNYFSLIWHFSFVAKVDAHKLNQMILSSGMSKQKNYSYWLNK